MVKTMGGGSQGDRLRPIASVRRRRRHVNEDEEHVEHENAEDVDVELEEAEPQMEVEDEDAPEIEGEGYPGGPRDGTLLTGYEDNVAMQLWNGVDRGELKLVSHGRKMSKMGAPHPRILPAVELSGLTALIGASYDTIDKGLLCAFVERWHPKTNSFHLPVDELTITLDDVSNLLHLPIMGQFYTYPSLDTATATDLLVDSLRVDRGVAAAETRHCRDGHVRLSWLREMYEDACTRRQ
ncbi:protein MAIN-LIKE 2-like [Phaseolus vulgaris]|uniref:protein MAIN-LIKE 2-like n=1 Tax=Phaseolus vulgaris TaxID=3885 RepID=UPI0035CC51E7